MRYLLILLITTACNPFKQIKPEVGDCVLGPNMEVWKLMNTAEKKYLFAKYPVLEGSPVLVINDVSALKLVECPK
jgi:hypothetical protein